MNKYQANRFVLHSVLYFGSLIAAMRCNAAYNPNNPCDFPSVCVANTPFSINAGDVGSAGGCKDQVVKICLPLLVDAPTPGTLSLIYEGCEKQNKTISYTFPVLQWNWSAFKDSPNGNPVATGTAPGEGFTHCAEFTPNSAGNYYVVFTAVFGDIEMGLPASMMTGLNCLPSAPALSIVVPCQVCDLTVICKELALTGEQCSDSNNFYFYDETITALGAAPSRKSVTPDPDNILGVRPDCLYKTGVPVVPAINATLIKLAAGTPVCGNIQFTQVPAAGSTLTACQSINIEIYASNMTCRKLSCSVPMTYEPCLLLRAAYSDAITLRMLNQAKLNVATSNTRQCSGCLGQFTYISTCHVGYWNLWNMLTPSPVPLIDSWESALAYWEAQEAAAQLAAPALLAAESAAKAAWLGCAPGGKTTNWGPTPLCP